MSLTTKPVWYIQSNFMLASRVRDGIYNTVVRDDDDLDIEATHMYLPRRFPATPSGASRPPAVRLPP